MKVTTEHLRPCGPSLPDDGVCLLSAQASTSQASGGRGLQVKGPRSPSHRCVPSPPRPGLTGAGAWHVPDWHSGRVGCDHTEAATTSDAAAFPTTGRGCSRAFSPPREGTRQRLPLPPALGSDPFCPQQTGDPLSSPPGTRDSFTLKWKLFSGGPSPAP